MLKRSAYALRFFFSCAGREGPGEGGSVVKGVTGGRPAGEVC